MTSRATNRAAIVSSASEASVVAAASRIKSDVSQGVWINQANAYASNCIAAVHQQAPLRQFVGSDLQEYVAASIPLHCLDGWAFLGRALDSHVKGDTYGAVHLAYYAELRAAMAILAASGIAVLRTEHIVFDRNGTAQLVDGIPTHDFAWQALQTWAQRAGSGAIVTQLISAGSHSVADWLEEFGRGYVNQTIAANWLLSWSLDLQQSSGDRISRNQASYRPTVLSGRVRPGAFASSGVLRDLWGILEPDTTNGFAKLDTYLLRLAFENAFLAATGNSAANDPAGFLRRVDSTISAFSFSTTAAADWKAFLTRSDHRSADPMVIAKAAGNSGPGSHDFHLEVISRATLLLRVASGMAAKTLKDASFTQSDLDQWAIREANELGLASPTSPYAHPSDLWAEVEDRLHELEDWETLPTSPASPRIDWFREVPEALVVLGGAERVALWSLT